ncbi:MFS transporter [Leucobacter sp. wl10]|uniref:MFS transporter n=1 Tax=Leucobacter sp. wl10 TaxID=2304677 RepID=UPI0013C2F0C5|nr:MFS transporter [Leucobacter sp. wl10]
MSHESVPPTTGSIPAPSGRPSWGEAFGVLRVPNFRRFVSAYGVLVTSLSMQRIMLAWSVLEVSGDLTHVGLAVATQYLPMLLLGLPGGVVADRWSKRRTLLACQLGYLALAVAVLVIAFAQSLDLVAIYLFGALIGVVQAFHLPASQGIIGEMVSARAIPAAISLTSSAFQAGQVIGPALGGLLLAQLGTAWSWAVNLLVVAISMLLLLRVDRSRLTIRHRPPGDRTTVSEGLRYVARKPTLTIVLLLILIISICVYATPVFLTAYAEQEFRIGAAGYGMLTSIMAVGALAGAVLSAKRPAPTLAMILLFTVALGVSQAIMGLVYALALFSATLFIRGATSLFTTTAANSFVQLRTHPLMLGRVMSFYGIMMNGGMALGNLVIGALIAGFGVRPVMIAAGVLPAVLALAVWLFVRRSGPGAGRAER